MVLGLTKKQNAWRKSVQAMAKEAPRDGSCNSGTETVWGRGNVFPRYLTGFYGRTGSLIANRELWALLRDVVHQNLREKIEKSGTKCPPGADSPFSLIEKRGWVHDKAEIGVHLPSGICSDAWLGMVPISLDFHKVLLMKSWTSSTFISSCSNRFLAACKNNLHHEHPPRAE